MKDHISFSQLNMFLRCGIQYQFRYIDNIVIPPSASLVRGKACHKAFEENFKQKITSKKDLLVEAVKDCFSDTWEANKYSIAYAEEELNGDSPKLTETRFKDSGIRLVEVFHNDIAPITNPVIVEDSFDIHFEGGYPKLTGRIDRIDEGDIIAEEKFVSKSPTADDIERDVQLTNYDMGFRQKYKRKPSKLIKQWAVATKTPKTVIQEAPPRSDTTIQRYLFRLEAFLKALEKGVFIPSTDGWWCTARWCGYWDRCKYHP